MLKLLSKVNKSFTPYCITKNEAPLTIHVKPLKSTSKSDQQNQPKPKRVPPSRPPTDTNFKERRPGGKH